ncbi:MATE family efflux transporter [Zobellia galactanivorans]|uniref:Multidrug-efflux transporter n=1 Tax=Zobellia galactanivorans (strain DSM 12802 / CCUG 47099 / CIP 106680 / NCIMB 13871 / Dsij) TaxID=63186 RepID=G0L4A8_ZOBGA|nr:MULTISPECIES: MATE family efflux transporter [Zobellia]MBU3027938.1 MATE family efflux transporter [Zobellia galactanivorans]MDO6808217.1 MATE family efflux transporter [Zobellia galactanivorans]OWW26646.1 MATE family efflux transporter [Zobellia sp. OII3]CAZ95597.1 Multi antimicrobial extrusion protein family [Zobellia galactanivorans]
MKAEINFRSINKLAIPATVAGIAEPLLSITDTAIVGNIPVDGLESLAAAGIVGSFLSMLIWILGQTRSAISAIISQYLGAGRIAEVKTLPAQAIFLNIGLSILVLLSTIFVVEDIFQLLNATGKILDYCVSYYSIRVWGFPLTLFVFAVMGIFRGLQNTYYPMLIAIVGAVLNVGLDFAFVYGIEGLIEPMYLEGAAWASLLAQAVMAIMAFVLLVTKTNISLRLKLPVHEELGRLVVMSLNLFVRALALNTALILAVREATDLGPKFIGAHTIAVNIWLFSAFFIDGYAAAGNIMGGRLLGAKDYKGLWQLAKKIVYYGLLVSVVLVVAGFLFYKPIGLLFSKEAVVLNAFYAVFFIVILGLPMNTIAFVFDGIFKGMGEMKYLRNTLLAATFLGFVPVVFLGKYMGWGLYGIWIAFTVWMAIRGGALVVKFIRKFRPLLQNH